MEKKSLKMGTLYDFNKGLMETESKTYNISEHEKKVLKEGDTIVSDWFIENKAKFFMLLCKEESSYTIFNITSGNEKDFSYEVCDCAASFGSVLSIEKINNNIEIWIKNRDLMSCYFLFPYDNGVIEIQ